MLGLLLLIKQPEPPTSISTTNNDKMDAGIKQLVCNICGKLFTTKKQRYKHLYEFHKINAKGERVPDNKVTCLTCDKSFANKTNLNCHMNAIHFISNNTPIFKCDHCTYKTISKSNLRKHNKKHDLSKDLPARIKCPDCTASFKYSAGFRYHQRKVHNIGSVSKASVRRKCPICSFVSTKYSRLEMYTHFQKIHNIPFRWETHTFKNLQLFHEWKSNMEKATNTYFIEKTKLQIYACHRNGSYKPRGKNIRKMKKKGTCKINAFCPSQIKIKVLQDGQVEAKHLPCHVGHDNELKHVPLTRQERESIRYQLINGTSHKDILKGIRASLDTDPRRIHLVKKKDIVNIERRLHLNNKTIEYNDTNKLKSKTSGEKDPLVTGNCELLNEVCVENTIVDEESIKRRFDENINKFVNYVKENAKSKDQMEYINNLMIQGELTLAAVASTSQYVVKEEIVYTSENNA